MLCRIFKVLLHCTISKWKWLVTHGIKRWAAGSKLRKWNAENYLLFYDTLLKIKIEIMKVMHIIWLHLFYSFRDESDLKVAILGLNKFNIYVHWFSCTKNYVYIKQWQWAPNYIIWFTICYLPSFFPYIFCSQLTIKNMFNKWAEDWSK